MNVPLNAVPAIRFVDSEIFTLRMFGPCMDCNFCKDSCCQYGCDVNVGERDRILALKEELEPFLGIPSSEWFHDEVFVDDEYPTGKFVRSQRKGEACVFLNKNGRGCQLHIFSLKTGRDYHQVKPMVCWLFPVCWDKGVLRPNTDVKDDLVCEGKGVTLYEASRDELRVVFGDGLIAELDAVRATMNVPANTGEYRAFRENKASVTVPQVTSQRP